MRKGTDFLTRELREVVEMNEPLEKERKGRGEPMKKTAVVQTAISLVDKRVHLPEQEKTRTWKNS